MGRRDFDDELLDVYEKAEAGNRVQGLIPKHATFVEFAPGLVLPPDAITQVYAFMGKRGSGKTYGAGKLAETFLEAKAQTIVMDPVGNWWGLRAGKDGKSAGFDIPVLGGEHGDIPLSADAGEIVADMLVDTASSAVLDVSPFSKSDRKKFIAAFAEHFFQRKKTRRSAVHIFIEEAHLVLPQQPRSGEERMLGALEDLVRLGRNYGIGVSMLDQRPQSVSKEALNQAEVLLAFKLIGAHERDAVKKWVDYHGVGADLARISKLDPGQAIVWSSWLEKPGIYRIHKKKTFDSSKTPKAGEVLPDVELRPLDLEALHEAMKKSVGDADAAKLDTRDVRALKKRVAELDEANTLLCEQRDKLLGCHGALVEISDIIYGKGYSANPHPPAIVDAVRDLMVHKAGFDSDDGAALQAAISAMTEGIEKVRHVLNKDHKSILPEAYPKPVRPLPPDHVLDERDVIVPRPSLKAPGFVQVLNEPKASKGNAHHRILGAILYLMQGERPPTMADVAILAGYSSGASTVHGYLSKLRSELLITGNGVYELTAAGKALAKKQPKPGTSKERIAYWVSEMGAAGKVLAVLAGTSAHGGFDHDGICKAAGYSSDASTVHGYLSKLKTKGLVVKSGRLYMLNPILRWEP